MSAGREAVARSDAYFARYARIRSEPLGSDRTVGRGAAGEGRRVGAARGGAWWWLAGVGRRCRYGAWPAEERAWVGAARRCEPVGRVHDGCRWPGTALGAAKRARHGCASTASSCGHVGVGEGMGESAAGRSPPCGARGWSSSPGALQGRRSTAMTQAPVDCGNGGGG
jgi:hypothetical protein